MQPLRIGINALYLIPGGVGGTEIYLRSLLAAFGETDPLNEYFVFTNRETGDDLAPARFHRVPCNVRASLRPWRIAYEQSVLPRLLARYRIDVVLNPGFTAPVLARCPSVTVFHDMQHKRHPEFFRWFDRPFWNVLLCLAARRSRRLIAVSEATARDIAEFFPWAASKTAVVPHGVDREFFRIGERRREHPEVTDPYILAVSTLHPHKNIQRLMEAFQMFRQSHGEFRMVVAGLKGFAANQLESRRHALGLENSVVFTGWIPRPELYALFEKASAFVAPGLFEGFGMPVLEALAAGLPTACSSIAPFDPMADGVAARFDPLSVAQIAAAMEMVVTDSGFRSQAVACGPLRARQFDWRRTAELTLAELRSAYNMSRK